MSAYQLYSSPGSCSLAPHVMLRELNLAYELFMVPISDGATRTPEFLTLNPRGSVPVLVTPQGQVIREGAAIILHILGGQDNKLLPLQAGPRAVVLEWLMTANASIHPLYSRLFFFAKQLGAEAKDHALVKATVKQLQNLWDEVETRLEGRNYVCGEEVSPGDILLAVFSDWHSKIPAAPELGPNTQRLIEKIKARPAYQEAVAAEKAQQAKAA